MFWYLVNIPKVNVWNLYRRHFVQFEKPKRQMFCLLKFSTAFKNALIHASKSVIVNSPGRPSKRASSDNSGNSQRKRASVPTPYLNVCYDQIEH